MHSQRIILKEIKLAREEKELTEVDDVEQLIEKMKVLQEGLKKATHTKNSSKKTVNVDLYKQTQAVLMQAAKMARKGCSQVNRVYPYLVPVNLLLTLLRNIYESYSILYDRSKKSSTIQLINKLAKLTYSLTKILNYTNIINLSGAVLSVGDVSIKSLLFYQKTASYYQAKQKKIELLKKIHDNETKLNEIKLYEIEGSHLSHLTTHLKCLRQQIDPQDEAIQEQQKNFILFVIHLLATGGLTVGNKISPSLTWISMSILLFEKMWKAKDAYYKSSKEQKLKCIDITSKNDDYLPDDDQLYNPRLVSSLQIANNENGLFFSFSNLKKLATSVCLTLDKKYWTPDYFYTPFSFPRKK